VVEFVWHNSIARPRKPPVIHQDLADISYTDRVIADFVPNFVAMATGVGRGRFVWRHSIARPRKLPVRRKYLRDVSYTSRVIADFVPNFVAMATGVGRGRICMASYVNGVGRGRIWLASFNSLTPKTPCYSQTSQRYLLYKPSYSR